MPERKRFFSIDPFPYITNQIKHLFKMNYGNKTSSTVRITIPKIDLEQTGDLVKQNNRNSKHKQARTKKKQQTTINKTKTSISMSRQVPTRQHQITTKQQQQQTTTNDNQGDINLGFLPGWLHSELFPLKFPQFFHFLPARLVGWNNKYRPDNKKQQQTNTNNNKQNNDEQRKHLKSNKPKHEQALTNKITINNK